ncbi:hypothetical protein MGN70_006192 [Eutypa lata]|uniref:Putative f-box domain protein n=1 Tax=Eutypa lata (strain UCR-EL1) TaxID=1287681 RepID=M7SMJ6_EUTLA|nr:putative f-box domain protein [Eutypa lata UCREL1]KAI1251624.1 hypothetical protein MGN70_006192 [Eutypa lata]
MTSATAAVLSTPELLEALFLECDIRNVLTSVQRVCRQWRGIVVSSPAVQAHLYLRPESKSKSKGKGKGKGKKSPTLNPLLAEVFAPFFAPFVINTSEGFWGRAEISALPLAGHPGPFMREDATWRAMHVQQPPLRALGVVMPSESYSIVYEQEREAIRMGELYDHVVRMLTNPGQRWRILWREAASLRTRTTLLDEFNAECTRDLLAEVDVVLVRSSDPWRSLSILPSDRDFMAKFTHPAVLRSRKLDLTPPTRVRGRMSRREQREL